MARRAGDRGYGAEHRRIRAALLPTMPGQPCTRCGITLRQGDDVHLDHTEDRTGYLGWACARCNTSAGGVKGGRSRRATSAAARFVRAVR